MLQELEGYDWAEAFAYAGETRSDGWGLSGAADVRAANPQGKVRLDPFSREDVAKLVACIEGENDGPSWEALGRLKDGRWFFLSACCDYTGWDCQAGGTATVARTKTELLRYGMTDHEKRRLGLA